jgi:hypothetical protein
MYLGYSIAALATVGVSYFATKHGMPVLDLQSEDCQLIGKGMMKGALHETHLDDIMKCIDKPETIVKNI